MEHRANPRTEQLRKKPPGLWDAIRQGLVYPIDHLLNSGAVTLDVRDSEGYTMLHLAAKVGQTKLVTYLLKKGGCPFAPRRTIFGDQYVDDDHVRPWKEHSDDYPIYSAARRGHTKVVKVLFDHMEPCMQHRPGRVIVASPLPPCLAKTWRDFFVFLWYYNSHPIIPVAALGKNHDTVALLLSRGSPLCSRVSPYSAKYDAIRLALGVPRDDFICMLLEHGSTAQRAFDVNDLVRLVLTKMVKLQSFELAKLVVQHGQWFIVKKSLHLKYFRELLQTGNAELCELWADGFAVSLVEPMVDSGYRPIYYAIQGGHLSLVEWLWSRGVNLNECLFGDGCRPVHVAARCGHVDILRFLCSNGVDLKAMTFDKNHPRNALDIALGQGAACLEATGFLLRQGVKATNESEVLGPLSQIIVVLDETPRERYIAALMHSYGSPMEGVLRQNLRLLQGPSEFALASAYPMFLLGQMLHSVWHQRARVTLLASGWWKDPLWMEIVRRMAFLAPYLQRVIIIKGIDARSRRASVQSLLSQRRQLGHIHAAMALLRTIFGGCLG